MRSEISKGPNRLAQLDESPAKREALDLGVKMYPAHLKAASNKSMTPWCRDSRRLESLRIFAFMRSLSFVTVIMPPILGAYFESDTDGANSDAACYPRSIFSASARPTLGCCPTVRRETGKDSLL
jgi:hypothetical protein